MVPESRNSVVGATPYMVLCAAYLLTAVLRRIITCSALLKCTYQRGILSSKYVLCFMVLSLCFSFLVLSLTGTVTTLPSLGWQRRLKSMNMVQSFRMQWIFTTLRMKWPVIPKSGRHCLCIYTQTAFSVSLLMCCFLLFCFLSAMGNTWLGGEGWKAGELVVYSEWDDVALSTPVWVCWAQVFREGSLW